MLRRRDQGFTLVELMVTLVVAAVLLSIAVPGFNSILQNNRLTTSINRFVTSLNLARSEAVKRGAVVRITATDPSDSSSEWSSGWSVWVDLDSSGTMDAIEVLATDQALDDSMVLDSTGGVSTFVYRADGSLSSGSDTLNLCDSRRTGETGRSVTVNANGRVVLDPGHVCP